MIAKECEFVFEDSIPCGACCEFDYPVDVHVESGSEHWVGLVIESLFYGRPGGECAEVRPHGGEMF